MTKIINLIICAVITTVIVWLAFVAGHVFGIGVITAALAAWLVADMTDRWRGQQ